MGTTPGDLGIAAARQEDTDPRHQRGERARWEHIEWALVTYGQVIGLRAQELTQAVLWMDVRGYAFTVRTSTDPYATPDDDPINLKEDRSARYHTYHIKRD